MKFFVATLILLVAGSFDLLLSFALAAFAMNGLAGATGSENDLSNLGVALVCVAVAIAFPVHAVYVLRAHEGSLSSVLRSDTVITLAAASCIWLVVGGAVVGFVLLVSP